MKLATIQLQGDEESPEIDRKLVEVLLNLTAFNFQCNKGRQENDNQLEEIHQNLRALNGNRTRLVEEGRPSQFELGNRHPQTTHLAMELIDELIEAEKWCITYRSSYWQLRKELLEVFNALKESLLYQVALAKDDRLRLMRTNYFW